ncbi:hypothetical protein MKW98_014817 [Papaver atlanticum]|uniref:Uncharacterized protein n=1 Tax=Papaver atlanticum TaxID=357466 RepID=A0AAD4XCY7_9MAGN|nr:hypothetical protein MKW98_014817 [Papaver atlanticum]
MAKLEIYTKFTNAVVVVVAFPLVVSFLRFVTSKIACCAQEPSNGIRLCTVAPNHCFDRDWL